MSQHDSLGSFTIWGYEEVPFKAKSLAKGILGKVTYLVTRKRPTSKPPVGTK